MIKLRILLKVTPYLLAILVGLTAAKCDAPQTPEPTQHTNERGLPIEKPVPTGCKGKVVDRLVEADGRIFIEYYTDAKCQATKRTEISEAEDLNARCWEGYFPQCLKWEETEGPGIRQPIDPASWWDAPGLVVDRNKGWGKLWVKVGFHDGSTQIFYVKKVYRNRCQVGKHWPDCRKGPLAS